MICMAKWLGTAWLVPGTPTPLLEEARISAHESLKIAPNNAFALGFLVSIEYISGNLAEATRFNNLLNAVDPLRHHMNKAAMALRQNKQDIALRSYRTAQKKKKIRLMDISGTATEWLRAAIPIYGEQMRLGLAFLLDDAGHPDALAEFRQIDQSQLEPKSLTFVRGRIDALNRTPALSPPSNLTPR